MKKVTWFQVVALVMGLMVMLSTSAWAVVATDVPGGTLKLLFSNGVGAVGNIAYVNSSGNSALVNTLDTTALVGNIPGANYAMTNCAFTNGPGRACIYCDELAIASQTFNTQATGAVWYMPASGNKVIEYIIGLTLQPSAQTLTSTGFKNTDAVTGGICVTK